MLLKELNHILINILKKQGIGSHNDGAALLGIKFLNVRQGVVFRDLGHARGRHSGDGHTIVGVDDYNWLRPSLEFVHAIRVFLGQLSEGFICVISVHGTRE